ncbi:hypothetical protein RDABS01_001648 [Bienertia sinuspersici]
MEMHLNSEVVSRLCLALVNLIRSRNSLLIYDSPYLALRTKTWAHLSYQLASSYFPVVTQGYFNQIESSDQKWGGRYSIQGVRAFSTWKTNWELTDIPFHGVHFTWCNNREGNHRVYERLDHATATQDGFNCVPKPQS